jgi:pimeloyl-ACP methyl ester carboxylesterase
LILESPYYSIADVAQSRFPIFPVKKLLKYHIPTYQFITAVTCPITIFHGTEDVIVPFKSGEKLYNSISNTKVQFIPIEKGSHNNLIEFDSYHKTIEKLLQ